MKKTFVISHPRKKYDRLIEAVKHDVNKYVKRERNKPMPETVDFIDFDCKFGTTEAKAKKVHLAEISKCIDKAADKELESFYIEILSSVVP